MAAHIPYGYHIVNGKAVVDEVQAEQIRKFFREYISGKALKAAAEKVGLRIFHGSAGRDDYYPAIVEQELFDKAEEERQFRANKLGRVRELKVKEIPAVPLHFTIRRQTKVIYDPFEQAEYAYSLIESEMNLNGNN